MTNRQVLLTVSLLLIQSFAMANFRAEKSEGLFSAQDFLKQVDCKKPSNFQSSKKQELKIKGTLLHDLSGILNKDEHFVPRVDGMSIEKQTIKNK